MKVLIAPLKFFSNIWTTKWYKLINHLINDYNWILIDITDYKDKKVNFKDFLAKHVEPEDIECILYWHQNQYQHFTELFMNIIDYPKIYLYYDDIHYMVQLKLIEINKYATKFFSPAPITAINSYLKPVSDKYIFIPHGATTEFASNFMLNPINKILCSGAIIYPYYPYRIKMRELSKTYEEIDTLNHPGYFVKDYNNKCIGKNYAEKLNKYICCFCSSGIHINGNDKIYYIVSKIFEICATGSLLLINKEVCPELNNLGFRNMVHFIEYDENNLTESIEYVLDPMNKEIIDDIRKVGQEFVLENHMSDCRAKLINNIVETTILP